MSGGSASHPDLAAAEALGPTRGWAMVDPTRDGLERPKFDTFIAKAYPVGSEQPQNTHEA
jgi:hypothetical protein